MERTFKWLFESSKKWKKLHLWLFAIHVHLLIIFLIHFRALESELRYFKNLYKEKCKAEIKQRKEVKRLGSDRHKKQIVTNHLLALKKFTPAQIRVIAHNKKYAHYTTEDIARNVVLYSINKSAYEQQYKHGGLPMPEKSTLERYVYFDKFNFRSVWSSIGSISSKFDKFKVR